MKKISKKEIEEVQKTLTKKAVENPTAYNKEMSKMKAQNIKHIKHSDTYIKLFYDVTRMLDKIDFLLGHDALKHEMKRTGNLFLKHLESFNSAMFNVSDESQQKVLNLLKEREDIEDIIDSIHESYYPTILTKLKEYAVTKNSDVICSKQNDLQFTMFKEFILPKNVKDLILKLVPEANSLNLLHLNGVLKREDVEKRARKKETVETIQKLFQGAYLTW